MSPCAPAQPMQKPPKTAWRRVSLDMRVSSRIAGDGAGIDIPASGRSAGSMGKTGSCA
jgi:hypothetical protein